MTLRYSLAGTFIESCNCQVVCPCWVNDEPDEDFCAGLFAWTFDSHSTIEDQEVDGRTVVSVTMHGDGRRGSQSTSAIYVDHAATEQVAALLVQAFSGRGGGPLRDLAGVTGAVVDAGRAAVSVDHEAGGWQVGVRAAGAQLVRAEGQPKRFDADPTPLTLTHTALSAELGVVGGAVVAQQAALLQVDVAALPGPPVDVLGRSGMTGRFRYHSPGQDDDKKSAELAEPRSRRRPR